MKIVIMTILVTIFLFGCSQVSEVDNMKNNDNYSKISVNATELATFAGGCFWCSESDFEKQKGVIKVISGYTGGDEENPTYKQVSSGSTGHREAIQVTYDPKQISYEKLLEVYWKHINPTDDGGSFVDRGFQYTSAIFYHNEEQKKLAQESKDYIDETGIFDKPVVTQILPYKIFYPAEEYHQDYYKKNPIRYKFYRSRSGRDQFIESNWQNVSFNLNDDGKMVYSKPNQEILKNQLSEIQYYVTQKNGTEKPFDNEYWNNTKDGIYVDVVSGEPLFSSTDKFKSGTGWPSFTKPIDEDYVVLKNDYKLIIPRKEVRSKYGDSHLGHVFKDGPKPTGLRYCMNSAALRFIPKEDLKKEGYEEYLNLFE